jgi:hypothetical protein
MITIGQLNAIPGRPDGAVAIWIVPHDNARMLYAFAAYIRSVEIEIERMKEAVE